MKPKVNALHTPHTKAFVGTFYPVYLLLYDMKREGRYVFLDRLRQAVTQYRGD